MSPLRRSIAGTVRGLFAEPGGTPRDPDADPFPAPPGQALFPADSPTRAVHGDVTAMMIGGISALYLQMLHPGALAGVWDHSDFRKDMHGRLRRTARFIAITTFGTRAAADATIARINAIHARVTGTLPDGTPYRATDPDLLAWVHVTEAWSFLGAHLRYVNPAMPRHAQDRYYADMAVIAARLGAPDMPETRSAVEAYLRATRPALRADARVRSTAAALRNQPAPRPELAPFARITMQAGLDLLPGWARRMHDLRALPGQRPATRIAAGTLRQTVSWAMAG
ncbi:MAG: oxygenase MpaB family protein [Pseudomonadota bacterium]